jgi:hypothetical protein
MTRATCRPASPLRSLRLASTRRSVALRRLASVEAPEEARMIGALPPLAGDLWLRVKACVRRLRLSYELCHVPTAELEAFAEDQRPRTGAAATEEVTCRG